MVNKVTLFRSPVSDPEVFLRALRDINQKLIFKKVYKHDYNTSDGNKRKTLRRSITRDCVRLLKKNKKQLLKAVLRLFSSEGLASVKGEAVLFSEGYKKRGKEPRCEAAFQEFIQIIEEIQTYDLFPSSSEESISSSEESISADL